MTDTDTGHTVVDETVDTVVDDAPEAEGTDTGEATEESPDDDAEAFPREYVEKLRSQSAKYRDRSKVADALAQRLHTELVRATGRLADPTDLEFDETHLDDSDALTAAIDGLLERKPHLASRKPSGDIGQGHRGGSAEPFSLLGMLKERT